MKNTNAETLLQEELPLSLRSNFVPIINRAYELTQQLVAQYDFLQWRVGKDIIPVIRRILIEHQFKKMIDAGLLELEYRVAPNKIDNCHHIELITRKNGIITISQVRHHTHMPRRACFRENLGYNNRYIQTSLFDDGVERKSEYHYILLTHGYSGSKPSFVYIGMPEPNLRGWIKRINLLSEPYKIVSAQEDIITEELLVEIKEELLERKVIKSGEAK